LFEESGACTPDSLIVDGEWWRIVTSMFIHRDLMHIFGNMLGYSLAAFALTHYLNGRSITLVFLISGALSIAFAVLYSQHSVIGASGGVFGLDGAFMSLFFWDYLFGKRSYERPDIWFFIIGVTLIINIVVGFRSDISMSGHISGFVIGAIVVWIFRYLESKLSRK
jgi:rhomboid protease GluP